MLVDHLLGSLGVDDRDLPDTLGSLVINEFKDVNKVISILVTLPENLEIKTSKKSLCLMCIPKIINPQALCFY